LFLCVACFTSISYPEILRYILSPCHVFVRYAPYITIFSQSNKLLSVKLNCGWKGRNGTQSALRHLSTFVIAELKIVDFEADDKYLTCWPLYSDIRSAPPSYWLC
jgi:hypothetical protein